MDLFTALFIRPLYKITILMKVNGKIGIKQQKTKKVPLADSFHPNPSL